MGLPSGEVKCKVDQSARHSLGQHQLVHPSTVAARKSYIEQFPNPTSDWLREEEPVNRLTTRSTCDRRARASRTALTQMAGEFADVLETGGDALLWSPMSGVL